MDRIRASKNFAKNLIYPRGEGEKAGGGGGLSIEPGFISHNLPFLGAFLDFFLNPGFCLVSSYFSPSPSSPVGHRAGKLCPRHREKKE
jgi:hypothetical protein